MCEPKEKCQPDYWKEENGHLSWGKPKPNLESCSANVDEEEMYISSV
jgi:hypothetical protein